MGKTPVFKPYDSDQMQLLPPSLEELITENHPARIVKKIIDQIDIRPINRKYKGGGASSYHPRMLLKVLVYGYLTNTYSSRKLEEQVRQNIHFMWLCGMKTPDHNTINRFRSEKLSDILKQIFSQIVLLLAEEGIVSLKEAVFTDGTKIESAANRYTFVWGKSIKTSKERIKSQLDDLWKYAQGVAAEELKDASPSSFEQVDAEQVRKTIAKIDRALEDKQVDKKVKQKLNYARRNWPDNLERYEDQEKKMGSRNSMSKTDPDATFMRMKEDHMLNGQLKPGYNLQISTQHQFILNYSLHSNPTDTLTLPAHLQQYEDLYGLTPSAVVADAGYGSDENYSLLESKQIAAYIKFGSFDQNQKGKQLPFSMEGLHYNQQEDCLYCPMGQKMSLIGFTKRTTASGFQQVSSRYQALNCHGCPLRGQCHKSQGNRIVEVNHRLKAHKERAGKLLNSEQGIRYRKKRAVDVEPVFANIKSNHGFKRFLLKGMTKAEVEIGLLSIAHNLRKWKA
ncbi:IS1182 family transposase [Sphingobacterium thalpophilum]|jgi:Transposase and inactivated derivatives|uniref:IS1182 family transposase n=1 Tax=Sphingobacterium thalpophilum TaxID=259 RepID=A0ABV4HI17_9SPHI|nr:MULTISPECIES: IS1182 family transposase [Bacteroidota]MDV3704640.1 IS5/IS1182 family transposase [Elizabethkingia anophelis]MDV3712687.1 IS5/IS1182 family transposase [Elizabethkingia anophelis]MDV3767404.1 IS5/IS1182 family transposase [Elizabethkingia anophelis]ODM53800.1 transposase [Elizabethkingia meningoseptica]OHT29028.1 transposase [Elizabethkingia meningoseptica]